MRILYVAELVPNQTAAMRLRILRELGHEVAALNFGPYLQRGNRIVQALQHRTSLSLGVRALNKEFVQRSRELRPQVIWVDKGLCVWPGSLHAARAASGGVLVHYNPDDPFGEYRSGWWNFIRTIPVYDLHLVPRPQNVVEYKAHGAMRVMEFDRSFDPQIHRPHCLNDEQRSALYSPVGFVGTWAMARAKSLALLAKQEVPLSIRGSQWPSRPYWAELSAAYKGPAVYGEEYATAICALDIALHFIRRENRDLQDSRSYEIPACGAFMLAERTVKHLEVFEEGKEAVFFDTDEELLDKVRYYQAHPEVRRKIAAAGRERCLRSGYSYQDRLGAVLDRISREFGI